MGTLGRKRPWMGSQFFTGHNAQALTYCFTPWGNIALLWEVGGQPESLEGTHADIENMQNSLESNLSLGTNQGPWSCEREKPLAVTPCHLLSDVEI